MSRKILEKDIRIGLTYDDVLLVPQRSGVRSRKDVSSATYLSRNIPLNIPIVASNMDTVCESNMAVAMAREGGIGILHRFCSVEEQCRMVSAVKRAQSFKIQRPGSVGPDATKPVAMRLMLAGVNGNAFRSLVVLDPNERFLGMLTIGDLQFATDDALVRDLMTPAEKLTVTHNPDITLDEARKLLHEGKVSNLPIVDATTGKLRFLITAADVRKLTANPLACLDQHSRLRVGAAVGVKRDDLSRARALVQAGADVLVIDIAHGHSDICIDMIKLLKKDPVTNKVDIIAGNIATRAAAVDLINAGADGLKIGVGPGSICITRTVAGSGVPQLSALLDVCNYANEVGVPCIADGGVRTSGDISKALAAGASTVMLGNTLAGTDESPGRVLTKDGRKVKIIRGMAGYGANISKAEREEQNDDVFLNMVPEGVEGIVAYKGPVGPILRQLVGGLRSGISYCGSTNLKEMRERAVFVRMTGSGLKESGHHDISKM
eukprot:PhM_4_TR7763/c2_g1_i2/m.70857/K00088/IMPDH, guaB; IMP dehydrogenase